MVETLFRDIIMCLSVENLRTWLPAVVLKILDLGLWSHIMIDQIGALFCRKLLYRITFILKSQIGFFLNFIDKLRFKYNKLNDTNNFS